MGRAAEVVAVLRVVKPTALTGRFAGHTAWRLRTVVLTSNIPVVRIKECLTVLTLALCGLTYHWPDSPQVNDLPVAVWKEENGEEKRGKRGEENRIK